MIEHGCMCTLVWNFIIDINTYTGHNKRRLIRGVLFWGLFSDMLLLFLRSAIRVSGDLCCLAWSTRLPVEQMNRREVSRLSADKPISHMRRTARRQAHQIYLLPPCRCIASPLLRRSQMQDENLFLPPAFRIQRSSLAVSCRESEGHT